VALCDEKWKLCRRESVEYIYHFPDAYSAGLPFCGSQDFQQILTIFSHDKRLFKFPCHLLQAFEINLMIAMLDIYVHSVMFILTWTQKQT
jgi:hypothetical protein